MGNPVAPAVAILYLDRFERQALERLDLKPDFLVRYIDDYAGVWLHGKEAMLAFVSYLNGIDDKIKFTCEMSGEGVGSVPMLDTLITLHCREGRCQFDSEVYVKPNNAGIVLHYRSAHPKRTKLNTLRSQLRRAIRLSSDVHARKRSLAKVRDLFAKNGYPSHVLKSVQRQVERETQNGGRTGDERDKSTRGSEGQGDGRSKGVLSLPYVSETVLCKVKHAVRRSGLNVNVASYTPDTLKRQLVHSSFSDPPCPSGNRTCNTCKMITKGRCTDKNVIYELTCTLCGDSYIGESKRPLRLRYNEHLRSAVNETQLTPIGDHFEACHQGLSKEEKLKNPPLQVKILMRAKDHPDRKIAESMFIRMKRPKLNDNMSSWRIISG